MTAESLRQLDLELARPELCDEGIEAARNACVAGASLAAAAVTAAAYYDNPLTGAPALRACMRCLGALRFELSVWQSELAPRAAAGAGEPAFTPGFGFVLPGGEIAAIAALRRLLEREPAATSPYRRFWVEHHRQLRKQAGALNATGLAALTFLDHGLDVDAAEQHFLLAKIAVALREAQAARQVGVAAIPFGGVRYVYEGPLPAPKPRDRRALLARVGIES
jgi:hypothetical protein